MTALRYLIALSLGVACALGAAADEPNKSKPKQDVPAFPSVDDILKNLPANLDPKPVEEIRKALEQARDAQQRALKLADEAGGKAVDEARKALEEARKAADAARKDALQIRPLERFRLGPPDGRLGIHVEMPSPTIADQFGLEKERGLVILDVKPDSAAAKAGLKPHDVLVEFNGKAVPSRIEEFIKQLDEIKADTKVDAIVYRKGKKETIKDITLPEAPKAPERPLRRPPSVRPLAPEDGAMLSITRSGDRITAHQREGTTSIHVMGKFADGKLAVESITVGEGRQTEKYDGIDKVPEKQRDKVKALVDSVEKMLKSEK